MILSPHRILWYSYSPPPPLPRLIGSQCSTVPPFSSIGDDWPLSPSPLLLLHFTSRPMGFPQRIFHTFRKMNESWSLIGWAKLSGALDKMIESHTKSYTDKLQDITCARGWGPIFIFVWQTQVDVLSVHVQVTWRLWNYPPLALHDTRLGILSDRRVTHLAPQLTAAMRKETHPSALIEE